MPVGRFAPSPTGDLHFGSLLAALASYCDIKSRNGIWQLRIDDIDPPRSVAGSADDIQRTLERYGFHWDGPVVWQSQRADNYHEALTDLASQGLVYACNCSRSKLTGEVIYPGYCRSKVVADLKRIPQDDYLDHALRCRLSGGIDFDDSVQGHQSIDLARDIGDIILWRRDGLVSYALACAIDDSDDVTHVVRGADLLHSVGAQISIMRALGRESPNYAHIPVAIDVNGDKLSKHSKAQPIIQLESVSTILQAWHFLGQATIAPDSLDEFWKHAIALWSLESVPHATRLQL